MKYDIIVIIDVIEHIVNSQKFVYAMNNIKNSLTEQGIIIMAPIVKKCFKAQFYEKHWSLNDLKEVFPGFKFSQPVIWESNFSSIYVIEKN